MPADQQRRQLLERPCVDLGFGLPPTDPARIAAVPPTSRYGVLDGLPSAGALALGCSATRHPQRRPRRPAAHEPPQD